MLNVCLCVRCRPFQNKLDPIVVRLYELLAPESPFSICAQHKAPLIIFNYVPRSHSARECIWRMWNFIPTRSLSRRAESNSSRLIRLHFTIPTIYMVEGVLVVHTWDCLLVCCTRHTRASPGMYYIEYISVSVSASLEIEFHCSFVSNRTFRSFSISPFTGCGTKLIWFFFLLFADAIFLHFVTIFFGFMLPAHFSLLSTLKTTPARGRLK